MNPSASTAPCRLPASDLPVPPEMDRTQQPLEHMLLQLQTHVETLDAVVREELRRAFVSECGELVEEAQAAARAARRLRSELGRRVMWAGLVASAVWSSVVLLALSWLLPSPAQLRILQARREQLQAEIRVLRAQGGNLKLARCGERRRLCVRVDRRAPAYGAAGDYLVAAP